MFEKFPILRRAPTLRRPLVLPGGVRAPALGCLQRACGARINLKGYNCESRAPCLQPSLDCRGALALRIVLELPWHRHGKVRVEKVDKTKVDKETPISSAARRAARGATSAGASGRGEGERYFFFRILLTVREIDLAAPVATTGSNNITAHRPQGRLLRRGAVK